MLHLINKQNENIMKTLQEQYDDLDYELNNLLDNSGDDFEADEIAEKMELLLIQIKNN